ncbi:hypothetical protein [Mucilaginibacter sp. BT774]|uniref:hypothetical protein n=1 Tax=Mucilaginibacter sp. BT774 TaxID=3062276 RepID=UPI0026749F36|nr:hypothetical protein [Mucilaginibacter sp. BT774]MDO3628708.1 hypothetical protein [Mucilaginibacter sp. BT774]
MQNRQANPTSSIRLSHPSSNFQPPAGSDVKELNAKIVGNITPLKNVQGVWHGVSCQSPQLCRKR